MYIVYYENIFAEDSTVNYHLKSAVNMIAYILVSFEHILYYTILYYTMCMIIKTVFQYISLVSQSVSKWVDISGLQQYPIQILFNPATKLTCTWRYMSNAQQWGSQPLICKVLWLEYNTKQYLMIHNICILNWFKIASLVPVPSTILVGLANWSTNLCIIICQ